MESLEHVLSRLESLSSIDRQWIVERLPDEAKSRLMDELAVGASASSDIQQLFPSNFSAKDESLIETIAPEVAASILQRELPWVIATILRSANAGWTAQVIGKLPSAVRATVMTTLRESKYASAPVIASLRKTLVRRSAVELSSAIPTPENSPWHQRIRRFLGGVTP